MPWPSAPSVTAASPVSTPARALQLRRADLVAERGDRCDEVERRAHRALRVVLGRRRCPPHRHHRVADELLDRAAVEGDQPAARVEVAGQELAHLLRVARLGERREADQVGEEDGDEASLGRGRCARQSSTAPGWPPRQARCRIRRRTSPTARSARRRPGRRSQAPRRTHRRTCGWARSRSRSSSRRSRAEPSPNPAGS